MSSNFYAMPQFHVLFLKGISQMGRKLTNTKKPARFAVQSTLDEPTM